MRHSYPTAARQRSDWSEILVPLLSCRCAILLAQIGRTHAGVQKQYVNIIQNTKTEKGVDRGVPALLQYILRITNVCILFISLVPPTTYFSSTCYMNIAAKIIVSVRREVNMWQVPTSLPSPFLSFWKNNIAMTLIIMSVRNLFLEGCR